MALQRTRKTFLWWPVTIKGETRWMTWVLLVEQLELVGADLMDLDYQWRAVGFGVEK